MSRPPYKLFSLLLQYPDDPALQARDEMRTAIESLPKSAERSALMSFFDYYGSAPPVGLQQQYVETFDLQRRSSLYLTFYSDGDTRKRGQALVRLKQLYSAAGLELETRELPDFLPIMLEFADLAPGDILKRLLAEHRKALEVLRLHLEGLGSPYRHLLNGVCAGLPKLVAAELAAVGDLLKTGPPTEQVGLQPFAPPEVMPWRNSTR